MKIKLLFFFALLFSVTTKSQDFLDVEVKEVANTAGSNPSFFTRLNNDLIFKIYRTNQMSQEIWKYNLDSKSATVVKDFSLTEYTSPYAHSSNIVTFQHKALFIGKDENNKSNRKLFSTDGTSQGTIIIKDLGTVSNSDSYSYLFLSPQGKLYFIFERNLWITDGTESGTKKLSDSSFYYNDMQFSFIDNKLYFIWNQYSGTELWTSDGTLEGTKIIKTFAKDDYSNSSHIFYNNKMYFLAKDTDNKKYLWESDGTLENTKRNFEFNGNSLEGDVINGHMVFYNKNNEVFNSDGTLENTVKIGTVDATITKVFKFKNQLYFDTLTKFWKTDGTPENTKVFAIGEENINYDLVNISTNKNYFFVSPSDVSNYLRPVYSYDGNSGKPLSTVNRYTNYTSKINENQFFEADNKIFYSGLGSFYEGQELFYYDLATGTENKAADINYYYDSNARGFQNLNNHDIFIADYNNNVHLFSHEKDSGQIKALTFGGQFTQYAENAFLVNDQYYAFAYSTNGFFKSVGTAANSKFIDLEGYTITNFYPFKNVGAVIIGTKDSKTRIYLIKNDSQQPIVLKEVNNLGQYRYKNTESEVLNSELYFVFFDEYSRFEIWKTDGTSQNTKKAFNFPFNNVEYLNVIGVVNSKLMIAKSDRYDYNIFDLYSSTGTQESVTFVKNFTDRFTNYKIYFKDKLYFLNGSGNFYGTDGTSTGTTLIKNITYNMDYIMGNPFLKCGDYIYFKDRGEGSITRSNGLSSGTIKILPKQGNISYFDMACNKDYLYTFREDFYDNKNTKILRFNGKNSEKKIYDLKIKNLPESDSKFFYLYVQQEKSLFFSNGETLFFNGYNMYNGFEPYKITSFLEVNLSTADIQDIEKSKILIYPNPSSNSINFYSPENGNIKDVEIFDFTGKKLKTYNSLKNNQLDITSLQVGVYFVRWKIEGRSYSSKMIKQ